MGQSYPLISTKIRTPQRRQHLLQRDRLLDYLHNNIHHKLILVAAGAGYGKTSLLINFAHDTDLPVCWCSLDTNDTFAPTFIEYLVASIRQRFPSFGEAILEMLHSNGGPPEAVEPYVRLLVNEIEASIPQYFVIVLDDYHEVIDSEPVNALVDGLLRYLPEHCHIILASRGIPRRLTLTRLAARQEVVGLGVEHLRFTTDEIYALLKDLGHVDLTPEQARVLAERSEGWITGILLAAQTAWTGTTQDILQISGSSGGVFEYMAEEVLARQTQEKQTFMLGSALFPEMTPPLCDTLLDINNSAQLLRELYEQNLFTYPLDAEGSWYQYHQLFREFLVAKFERDDPHGYRSLCLKQAQILAHGGNWGRAVDSYLAADAYDQAAEALEIVAQESFDSGNWEYLKNWLDALPSTNLAQHPRLMLFRSKIYTDTGELTQAATLLEQAYQSYMARSDSLGAARVLVQTTVVQHFRGRLHEAIDTARTALEMAGDRDALTSIQAHRSIGTCYAMLGHFAEGVEELQKALKLAEANADDTNAAHLAYDLGSLETMRGRLVEARQYYHQTLLYWRKLGNAGNLALVLQNLGVVHHYLGQYAEAENRFMEAYAKAEAVGSGRAKAFALASHGDLLRDTGRYQQALETYRQALDLASSAQLLNLTIYILDATANTLRLQGDLNQARQVLTEAQDQIGERTMDYERGLCLLTGGILDWQCGAFDQAQEALLAACQVFSSGANRDLGRAQLYLAVLAQARGDTETMRQHLAETARLIGEVGSYQFIVAEGPAIQPLLQYVSDNGVPGLDCVRIRAEITQLFAPPAAVEESAEAREALPLEFLGLGGGEVFKSGARVTDWESAAARVMAFLFVAHPNGLRRDRVIDLLWPDVSPAKGNSLFHSTIYRLRSSLAKDIIVHDKGLYRINPHSNYRFDVDEFRTLLQTARANPSDAHVLRTKALDLYRTPFLEVCDSEWAQELREALQNDLLNALFEEAQYLVQAGMLREAEDYYIRALGIDSYDERAHRGIMWCRAQNNDRAGALRQYRECARILQSELDVDPSEETVELYTRIISGAPVPALT